MHRTHAMERGRYREQLDALRAELASRVAGLQARGDRMVIVVDGRDAAGKTGAIRRLVRHLPPRAYRVLHLGPPEPGVPYFARWHAGIPPPGTIAVLDRSWYNRAALEPVMGYCTRDETAAFLAEVPAFERELVEVHGIILLKLFLDVSRAEQARRLARRAAPTTIDRAALASWDAFSAAYATMFARTATPFAPWLTIAADDKRAARLCVIRAAIDRLAESESAGGGT